MTKIKNTKKGMAKKTLSMSLVVAMLATSNVPVWAAEFSDGTDVAVATEAPVADAFSDEADVAPVVDEATDTADVATATAPKLNLSDWTDKLKVSGEIKDGDNTLTNFDYEVRIDGKEVIGHEATGGVYKGYAYDVADLNDELKKAIFTADDAGHTVSVDISTWNYKTTIAGITIASADISGATLNLNGATVAYTGKQVAFTDDQISKFQISDTRLKASDFTYTYEGDDLVNATPSGKDLYVVATVNKAGYTGKIKTPFKIEKRTLDAGKLEVKLNKNTVSYAEKAKISSDYVSVKDTVTGETLPTSVYTVTSTSSLNNVGDESVLSVTTDSLSKDTKTNNNYQNVVSKETTDKVKVVANQMSDFKIVVDSIGKDYVTDTNSVKAAIHFYLGDKEVTSAVADAISVKPAALASGATTLSVAVNGDNKNVIGNTTVTLPVTLNKLTAEGLTYTIGSLKNQKANATTDLGAETYTGAAITKDIKDVRFVVTGTTTTTTVNLSSSDYKVEYVNDNTNAQAVSGKTVDVYIVGTGNYSGRVKIGSFVINAAEITKDDITVPAKVQYDGSLQTAADYMTGKVTVKAGATGKKKEVPADAYKLTYTSSTTPVTVGATITTKLVEADIKNKNYTTGATEVTASKTTAVTNKDIADTNVKVEVVGGPYTYTGKAITPNVKVAVDGVELAKDIDYTIKSCTNNVNAGEATVTVEGKGDYSGTQTVKFTINKANLSDVKVEANTKDRKAAFTYTGTQVKPTASDFNITLNGVKLNAADFVVTYPTTSKVNVNAGDAKVTIAPKKSNTNFTGDKMDVNFKILPQEISDSDLKGKFYAFDENGDVINFDSTDEYMFGYDGTEKTFKDIKFVPTINNKKLVEGKDYEIKYFNNVTGPVAYVYINAIGNYTNDSSQKFDGSEQTFVDRRAFSIDGVKVGRKNISISDTEYAGGVAVTPNVTIKVGEKTLVEGKDYKFEGLYNNSDVTGTGKVLYAELVLKGAYKFDNRGWSGSFEYYDEKTIEVAWKIVKKDLANTTVSVVKNGTTLKATVLNGTVIVPESEYDVKDNGDGTATVTAKSTSKNYTGSQKVDVKPGTKVGAPVISGVKVVGNKATVILSGEADGASGYDYVISKANDTTTARVDVTKNQVKTTGDFNYVQQGTYYAYCHAWRRNAEGKKVFGEWSNIYPFSVSAITPAQPVITSVKAKGTTVTVTYTKAANAEGYDVVLGSAAKKVNGEYRPVSYGKLVKKNIKGNVVTATFKNVKKGTYYAGLHAFNKTSEDGKKVFSQWSNVKKVTVK
nr:hypothetical protein [uncultured Blautia sp.]